MIFALLLGCVQERLDTGFWRLEYSDPSITAFNVACEDSQWTIQMYADHWTGNGLLWIANHDRYERHTLYSVSASPTGDGDRLFLRLNTVSDWRDAQSGRSSGFTCSEQTNLVFFGSVRHPQTLEITDCAEYVDEETFLDEPTSSSWNSAGVPLPDCPEESSNN